MERAKPEPVEIDLSWSEIELAANIGVKRRVIALLRNRSEPKGELKYANGADRSAWDSDIESSCAEYSVAKATGLFWQAEIKGDLRVAPPDVGCNVQVRSTTHPRGNHLIVYDTDSEAEDFFFVRGFVPTFLVLGWLPGLEAKDEKWWTKTPRGTMAFWIPDECLFDVRDYEPGRSRMWLPNSPGLVTAS